MKSCWSRDDAIPQLVPFVTENTKAVSISTMRSCGLSLCEALLLWTITKLIQRGGMGNGCGTVSSDSGFNYTKW